LRGPGWLLLAALQACAAAAQTGEDANPGMSPATPQLIQRLRQTRAVNLDDLLARQFTQPRHAPGFLLASPYLPPVTDSFSGGSLAKPTDHNTTVQAWWQDAAHGAEVCAVRFIDEARNQYELRSFSSGTAALHEGYQVTHQYRCGACSSLRDLAVYLERPDLTSPARACARKWGARRIKQCFTEKIGLSESCAESWAYNALNTRKACRSACIEAYGLLNLLLHRYPAPNNAPDGSLNACLQCDETRSGPGFRYSAGRTRRGSGIRSAIARPDEELFRVDHHAYFSEP